MTLAAPIPLDTELSVDVDADGSTATLLSDDGIVVAARIVEVVRLNVPESVGFDRAVEASTMSPVLQPGDAHPFATCFVCGPQRNLDDGMGLFPGEVLMNDGRSVFVAPHIPTAEFCATPFVWAALDCPSSFPMYAASEPFAGPLVLGRITASVNGPISAGEHYTVQAWRETADGRKLHTAVAMFDAGAKVVASAQSIWIRVRTIEARSGAVPDS